MAWRINPNDDIGKNIKEAREAAGLTQEQLTAKMQVLGCDVPRGALAKIESGIRYVRISEIKAIKEILKVSYDSLFRENS